MTAQRARSATGRTTTPTHRPHRTIYLESRRNLHVLSGLDSDPYDLRRFVDAQERDGTYLRAAHELRRGRKRSHWMWFVFPQLAGLGGSEMSRRYAVRSLDEARAYLDHPLLGRRIRECAVIVGASDARSAEELLGVIDALKLRSSMTLFLHAAPGERAFEGVLDRFFAGRMDEETERLLAP